MLKPMHNQDTSVSATDMTEDEDGLPALMEAIRALAAKQPKLPAERPLADQLGVKRHQLRRALAALRANGELPEPKPRARKGSGPLDLVANTNPIEVVEMRMMIEPTLARLAALRATPARIEAMQKAVEQIAAAAPDAPTPIDLHSMIAEASGNVLACEFYKLLRKVETDARLAAQVWPQRQPNDRAEHEAIVSAIAQRAPDKAEQAMRAHIAAIHRMLSLGI